MLYVITSLKISKLLRNLNKTNNTFNYLKRRDLFYLKISLFFLNSKISIKLESKLDKKKLNVYS